MRPLPFAISCLGFLCSCFSLLRSPTGGARVRGSLPIPLHAFFVRAAASDHRLPLQSPARRLCERAAMGPRKPPSAALFPRSSFAQSVVRVSTPSRGCHLLGGTIEEEIRKLRQALVEVVSRGAPPSAPRRRRGDGLKGDSWVALIAVSSPGVAISVNENADPTVRVDLKTTLDLLTGMEACGSSGEHTSLQLRHETGVNCRSAEGASRVSEQRRRRGSPARSSGRSSWDEAPEFPSEARSELAQIVSAMSSPCAASLLTEEKSGSRSDNVDFEGRKESWLMHIWTRHTSCSLSVTGRSCLRALEPLMSRVVPEDWNNTYFEHTYEGPDDMPAHAKTTLFTPDVFLSLTAPAGETQEDANCDALDAYQAEHAGMDSRFQMPDSETKDGKNSRRCRLGGESRGGQRVDFGYNQTVALNEHRDGGGWGGGRARKLVFSSIGIASQKETLQEERKRKAIAAFKRQLATIQAGAVHCSVHAPDSGLVIAPRMVTSFLEASAADGKASVEETYDHESSEREEGGAVVREVFEGIIPDNWDAPDTGGAGCEDHMSIVALGRAALLNSGLLIPIRAGELVCPPGHDVFVWAGAYADSDSEGRLMDRDGEPAKPPNVGSAELSRSRNRKFEVTCTLLGTQEASDGF
ncbi:hypothetical protein BESB_064410 [Besnoitia besnoiti]|uniref:Uncharacterized protein n=1 Tax=Besnoitia besnoiti TaxID=94643 RepID=A0A2A9MG81_BESBE|nr:hypothetical protein BESB_064410 [Besnoitia besnoiti]PFH34410.1 hypothetical protein BESB_064410 [Besnoitia besnoiti]